MDVINDLGIDLALAFLVEKKFRQKIESQDAARLIGRIRCLLDTPRAADEVAVNTDCKDREDWRASHA